MSRLDSILDPEVIVIDEVKPPMRLTILTYEQKQFYKQEFKILIMSIFGEALQARTVKEMRETFSRKVNEL